MKKLISLALVLCLVLSLGAGAFAEDASAQAKDLVILYTSDVHCGVDQNFGYAGLAAIKAAYEAAGNNVLLVDDGDAIQGEPVGTMTTGEAIVDIMNAVGYNVAIPGNHEFDYGMDRFLELVEKAEYPYISANFNKEGELVLPPYVMFAFEGMKVAFVGVTTPKTLTSSTPAYFQDEEGNFIYGFMQDETGEKLYAAIQSAVDAAAAEGADYVILVSHCGNEESCVPYTYVDIISNTTGIAAVLDGHSHDTDQVVMKNKNGEEVIRSAVGTKLEGIGVLTIRQDGSIASELNMWKNKTSAAALFGFENEGSAAAKAATSELSEKLAEVVAHSAVNLVINDVEAVDENGKPIRIIRRAETNLGDLCADAYRDQGQSDIAFVNGGGIRVAINAGDITLNDILKVHPFGNAMCVIEVSGQQVLDALEWGCHSLPGEAGAFLHVSGMSYQVRSDIDSPCIIDENGMFAGVDGERRVSNVLIAGAPIDPEATYTLASHNYMLKNSGDGFSMFAGCKLLQDEVKLDNQVLIDYITGTLGGVVGEAYANPYGEGRITSAE